MVGARCQLLVAKTASTMWANLLLKRCDAALAKVKDSISFESFTIHKAVTIEKFSKKPTKLLQFS